jgi:hypothetical protein
VVLIQGERRGGSIKNILYQARATYGETDIAISSTSNLSKASKSSSSDRWHPLILLLNFLGGLRDDGCCSLKTYF